MKVSYFPGCTLKTRAKHLDQPLCAAFAKLGVELVELPRWNCCGVVVSLADDNLLALVAPVRNLIRVQQEDSDHMLTACAMCYNTQAMTNRLVQQQPEKLSAINAFMEEEPDYRGKVRVWHALEFLREQVGWEELARHVCTPLTGLKVAAYYGCTLLRPKEVAIDPRHPAHVFEELLTTLGAEVVEHFSAAQLCCGSHHVVDQEDIANACSTRILDNARACGADLVVSCCPLCDFNLGQAAQLPTVYFSQLLALAVGVEPAGCRFDLNDEATYRLLSERQWLVA